VVLLAGRDLQANAVVIAASGEATLSAGRDVRLGAGGSKIPRAVGVGPTDPTAVAKDATNMPNIPSGSQARLVANNPYIPKSAGGTLSMTDYLPEAARVTQPGGEIVINGNAANKYFSNIPTHQELDGLGLTIMTCFPRLELIS
jgi:filamentous hemagglutinin